MHPRHRLLLFFVVRLQRFYLLGHSFDHGDKVGDDFAVVVFAVRLHQARNQRAVLDQLAGQKLIPLRAVQVHKVLIAHV